MTPQDIAALFERQRSTVENRRAEFGLAQRKAVLSSLRNAIVRRRADIVTAIAADFAKPEAETMITEIMPVLAEFAHTSSHLAKWMRSRRVPQTLGSLGTSARIRPEARGVCLIISPWNYPFNLAVSPLIAALAAGNSVILKPSELSPATSTLLAELVEQSIPPDLVAVVEGGADVAQMLLALPFDHIFFTGSPRIGKIVMAAAAKTLASVTLELGGKSPTIVGPKADIAKAARWIAWGKFTNAGQTCIAPDHVHVHIGVAEQFRHALREEITRVYGRDTAVRKASGDYARIVNDRHASRLRDMLDDLLSKGGRVIAGGAMDGRFIEPTLVEAITPDMEIDSQEIFGPILPIATFADLDEVIGRINARPKPLALYVFDREAGFAERVVAMTSSGAVGINLTMAHFGQFNLPFGGVNNSGLGAYHGIHGFRAFSHEKAVLTNWASALPLIFPPYQGRAGRMIGLMYRFFSRG